MSASDLPATDPGSLKPILVRRIPEAAGSAEAYLREAATEFFRRSECWRDQRMMLVTDEVRTRYELPTPSAGKVVCIRHVWQSTSTGEVKMHHDTQIRDDGVNDDIYDSEIGRNRWHEPHPGSIAFHKQLPEGTSLRLEVALTVGDDNVGNQSLIYLNREGILAGAAHYATMAQDKKTSNYYAGRDYYTMFETFIRDASSRYQQKSGVERRSMSRMQAMRTTRCR